MKKVLLEVDRAVGTVETRVHDAISDKLHNLVTPKVELVTKSVNASSGRDGSFPLDLPQITFWGNADGLQMTVSSRLNSSTDLKGIDDTLGNITLGAGDISTNEGNYDKQTHTHHNTRKFFNPLVNEGLPVIQIDDGLLLADDKRN